LNLLQTPLPAERDRRKRLTPVDLQRRANHAFLKALILLLSNRSISIIVRSDRTAYKSRCPARQQPMKVRP
jgi:hypothetical protein